MFLVSDYLFKKLSVELPFLGPTTILGLVSPIVSECFHFTIRNIKVSDPKPDLGLISLIFDFLNGILGELMGILGAMYVCSSKNMLFQVYFKLIVILHHILRF